MYENRVNTNFQGKKVPKEKVSYKCLYTEGFYYYY